MNGNKANKRQTAVPRVNNRCGIFMGKDKKKSNFTPI